jgi:hypothetical protein
MTGRLRGGEVWESHPCPRGTTRSRMNHFDSDLGLCNQPPNGVPLPGVGHPTFPTPAARRTDDCRRLAARLTEPDRIPHTGNAHAHQQRTTSSPTRTADSRSSNAARAVVAASRRGDRRDTRLSAADRQRDRFFRLSILTTASRHLLHTGFFSGRDQWGSSALFDRVSRRVGR